MKTIILSCLCVLLTSLSFGQGFYFRVGAGYALPVATDDIGENEMETYTETGTGSTTTESIENVSASFGAGMNFNLGAGYMFNKHVGIDFSVQYLKGRKYEVSDIYIYNGIGTSGRSEYIQTFQSQAIFFNPSFVLTSGTGAISPYARFGVIFGSPKIKVEESSYYDLDGTSTSHQEWDLKKGMALGFQGAVGVNWMLSNNLDLFAEINFVSMTYYAKEAELMASTSNGNDNMPNMTTYNKITEFKKEIDLTEDTFNPDEPRQELREATAFGSVSLQVGIRYLLKGHSVD